MRLIVVFSAVKAHNTCVHANPETARNRRRTYSVWEQVWPLQAAGVVCEFWVRLLRNACVHVYTIYYYESVVQY